MSGSHAGHGRRSGLLGHFAALFSALLASFRTLLAMRHFMLGALIATGFTDRRAQRCELASMSGVARHVLRGQAANVRAVAAELDAWHHGFDVIFIQTAGRAAFAGGDAGLKGVVAGGVFFQGRGIGSLGGHGGKDGQGHRECHCRAGENAHRCFVLYLGVELVGLAPVS